jgi:hypothetical protein
LAALTVALTVQIRPLAVLTVALTVQIRPLAVLADALTSIADAIYKL